MFLFTCKSCCARPVLPILGDKEILNSQLSLRGQSQNLRLEGQNQKLPLQGQNHKLPLQGQNQHQAASGCILQNRFNNPAQPVGKMEALTGTKSSACGGYNSVKKVRRDGEQSTAYGLIWKRKKGDDSDIDFRIKNILLKGKEAAYPDVVCYLCKKPYCSDLMYVRCGNCPSKYKQVWFCRNVAIQVMYVGLTYPLSLQNGSMQMLYNWRKPKYLIW